MLRKSVLMGMRVKTSKAGGTHKLNRGMSDAIVIAHNPYTGRFKLKGFVDSATESYKSFLGEEMTMYYEASWFEPRGKDTLPFKEQYPKENEMKKVNVKKVTVYDAGDKENDIKPRILIDEFPVFDTEKNAIYILVGQMLEGAKDKTPLDRITVEVTSIE